MKRAVLGTLLLLATTHADAQGCSQCRDNVTQISPQQQRAYRQAIALMGTGAIVLFSTIFVVARKFR